MCARLGVLSLNIEYSPVVTTRKDCVCVYFVNGISLVVYSTPLELIHYYVKCNALEFYVYMYVYIYIYISYICVPPSFSSLIRLCAKFAEYKKEEVIIFA